MHKLVLLLLFTSISFAQSPYPQDYFKSPVDIPIILSGTFGELRSSHFHSGIDIKTQQRQGLKIYASAEGYVSRIKVSHFGFGKALYITHPNGYTTVYAHLKKFNDRIERYIKMCQYEKESYEVEVFPSSDELLIDANEIIAYSGNTGGSGGPHLHFEIRDKAERPINPMLFGITAKDSRNPLVLAVYGYTLDDSASINGKVGRIPLRLIPKATGDFEIEKISAFGQIGFGVVTYDQLDYATNKNGVSNIQSFFNGNKSIEVDFKRFSFEESKHINRYIDYEFLKTNKSRIQKLFIEKNNPLSLYKDSYDKGFIRVEDSTASVYKVRIKDFSGNETWISIPISGKYNDVVTTMQISDTIPKTTIYNEKSTELKEGSISVNFFENTVYDSQLIDFKTNNDTLFLHRDIIPLQKNFHINYDITNYKSNDKDKLFVGKLYSRYRPPYYVESERKGNVLTAKAKAFGTYTLGVDTIAPKIKPVNFKNKKWMSKYRFLKIKIDDNLSGISKYRATVNGQWILMEYDYKTKTLVHDFNDNVIKDTKNEFRLIVTDNVGNSSTFEATFFRK